MEVARMEDVQAYCVKCKMQRTMKDAHEEKLDNGRRAAKGVCETCGTKMTKFLPNEKK
jgi:methionyl-tRNA synthetase